MLLLASLAFFTFWNPYPTDQYNWLNYIHPLDLYQNTYQVAYQGLQYVDSRYTDVRQFIHPLDGGTGGYGTVAGTTNYSSYNYPYTAYPTPAPAPPAPTPLPPMAACTVLGGYLVTPTCFAGMLPEQCQARCVLPTIPPQPTPPPLTAIQQCEAAGGHWAMPDCMAGTPAAQCQARCYMPSR